MPAFFESGFFVRTPAWHHLGRVMDSPPIDWDHAWSLANGGNAWDIFTEDIHDVEGNRLDGWKAIRRGDNERVLHVTTATYEMISMRDYGRLIDEVRSHYGDQIEYETTVVLHGGKRIATTLAIPSKLWEVHGDTSPVLPYLNFMTSHDESVSWKTGVSNVRIVCANTLGSAQKDMKRRRSALQLRHTSKWSDRVPEVIAALDEQIMGIDRLRKLAAELASSLISQARVTEYVEKLIPHSSDMTPRQLSNVMDRRAQFCEYLEAFTNERIAGTKWGLWQAAIEQIDHGSSTRSMELRADHAIFGGSDAAKERALNLVMSI